MSFYYNSARQPEILRTIQKDHSYSEQVNQHLSDVMRFTSHTHWIKYNQICKIFGELIYHGFATFNNVQTLGEEYTGIIRIDSRYISIPSKLVQFTSILLEFGGEPFFYRILRKLEKDIERNNELLPGAKENLLKVCTFMRSAVPYIKALHRSLFYVNGGTYHISKRITGINYVLVRHWLETNYSVTGYRILGYITLLQLFLVFGINLSKSLKSAEVMVTDSKKIFSRLESNQRQEQLDCDRPGKVCSLCLEIRQKTGCTQCGHLFCWKCIMDWLDQKEECPVCREALNKSAVVFLQNVQ